MIITLDDDPDGKGPLPETQPLLLRVPPHRLEILILMGRVHITRDATLLCLKEGIGVTWLNGNGRLLGRLVPEQSRCANVRLRQYASYANPAERAELARMFVGAKLVNAAAVLENIDANYPDSNLKVACDGLRDRIAVLKRAPTLPEILGHEGQGARLYFDALAQAGFRGLLTFEGRRQHPAPDPVNALLSFGYVLLANRIAGLLEARGLEPAIGFFHDPRDGRPSLALDLMEEFRHPLVDRFVLQAANRRQFRPEHFEPDPERPGGVRLRAWMLRQFFGLWQKALASPLPEAGGVAGAASDAAVAIQRQVERLTAHLRRNESYRPFLLGK
ncbi:MAG: CRISPR-associated endonuclease Cas1 [bacterium]|nr:CRISPR-associated endonuclease Cas1 [bacterium]